MEPFATLVELQSRLEWTLDADEERNATGALEDLSNWARYYGRDWVDAASAPRLVITLVLGAAARFLRNPDGYTQSRAGDETLAWADRGEDSGTVAFNKHEITALKNLVRPVTFGTIAMTAYGPHTRAVESGLIPAQGGGDPIPMFSDTTPW